MNVNDTLYTLDTSENIYSLNAILSSEDTEFTPSYDSLSGDLNITPYNTSSYDRCPYTKIEDQTCKDRKTQLWTLGYY